MFSKACEYALRSTLFIAKNSSEENKIGIDQVCKGIKSPRSFTAKVLQQLTRAEIVSSAKGPNGGFYISEKSLRQPMSSILKAMGEDKMLKKCVLGLKRCTDLNPCPMHDEYKLIKGRLSEMFDNKTIKQVAESNEKEFEILK